MKKIFALLLILTLAVPVMGWACQCCPSEAYDNYSHQPVLKAGHHDCCANANVEFSSCKGVNAPKFVMTNPREPLRIFQLLPSGDLERNFFKIFDSSESSKAIKRFLLTGFSPPAPEPLYLTHRTLLI